MTFLKRFSAIVLIVALVIVSQLILLAPASASTATDLYTQVNGVYGDRGYIVGVCNQGTGSVTSVTLDETVTNFSFTQYLLTDDPTSNAYPADEGTFNDSTMTWTGQLDHNQCFHIGQIGTVTGALGNTITLNVSIAHSILDDQSANVDPDTSNDSASYTSAPIVLDPDLSLTARLLTTGPITSGKTVSYELTLSNVGAGPYVFGSGDPLGIYFITPVGTTFNGVIDLDLTDGLSIPINGCEVVAPDVSTYAPAFAAYSGQLVGCQLDSTAPLASGASFKFQYDVDATSSFASGTTKILGAVAGNDVDSLLFQISLGQGVDPFSTPTNNDIVLTYDDTALAVTVNRCAGTGEVVNTNDACFTVSFNKPIYAPSFTLSDLVLSGGGNIYSFVQDSSTQWTVHINGMTPGGTLTLSLGAASVTDLSAVSNGTQVLGINTVRYEVPGSTSGSTKSASGTLATTGSQTTFLFLVAIIFLECGFILVSGTRKRQI